MKFSSFSDIVYSTNPDFVFEDEVEETEELKPSAQKLRVSLDKKQRGGKKVTLVTGYVGRKETLEALGKELKTSCGVGGSVKDGEILVQGDFRDRIVEILIKKGYTNTKKSGS